MVFLRTESFIERMGDMAKTDKQKLLEEQRSKPIKEILLRVMEAKYGQSNFTVQVAADLGISVPTFHAWCRQFSIDVDDYRQQPAEEPAVV